MLFPRKGFKKDAKQTFFVYNKVVYNKLRLHFYFNRGQLSEKQNSWAIWGMKFSRILALLMAILFLVVSSGCSHTPKQPTSPSGIETSSQKDTVYYYPPEDDKWWKKDENQWLVMALIILGVAIVSGAAVAVASGRGGLHIGVSK